MNKDSGVELSRLKVDGGMVANELLMQFQSDILNVPVIRPEGFGNHCPGRRLCRRSGSGFLVGAG